MYYYMTLRLGFLEHCSSTKDFWICRFVDKNCIDKNSRKRHFFLTVQRVHMAFFDSRRLLWRLYCYLYFWAYATRPGPSRCSSVWQFFLVILHAHGCRPLRQYMKCLLVILRLYFWGNAACRPSSHRSTCSTLWQMFVINFARKRLLATTAIQQMFDSNFALVLLLRKCSPPPIVAPL